MKATKKFKGMEDKELSFLKKKGASKAMVGHEAKEMKAEKKSGKPVEMSLGGMLKRYMFGHGRKMSSADAANPPKLFGGRGKLMGEIMRGNSPDKAAAIRKLLGGKQSSVNSDDFIARNPKPASFGQNMGMLGLMKGNRNFQQADDTPSPSNPIFNNNVPLRPKSMMDRAKTKSAIDGLSAKDPMYGDVNGNMRYVENRTPQQQMADAKFKADRSQEVQKQFEMLGLMPGRKQSATSGGAPALQPKKPDITAAGPNAPTSVMKKGGKVMKKGGCTKMATGGIAKANFGKGDLPGSKHFGRSTGEGIEKSYKANTKAVKHRQGDGCAQRGLTKIGRSKEK